MTRQQRGWACAIAIIPLTVACGSLLRCGCAVGGWTIEIVTALAYFTWITREES
jgi:hypothetical protein